MRRISDSRPVWQHSKFQTCLGYGKTLSPKIPKLVWKTLLYLIDSGERSFSLKVTAGFLWKYLHLC
jgi:hypothetical protein